MIVIHLYINKIGVVLIWFKLKKENRLSFLQLKRLVFIQINFRMFRTMVAREGLKELNLNTIDIEKVPTLHIRKENNEDHYAFLQDDSPEVAQPVKRSY